jgi:preprotein translocase subunit SecG
MSGLVIVIHVLVSVALILIVLLQTGKGADIGAAFGGGASHTLFGSGGASSFLSKLTTIAAVVFMLTSLGLAYMSGHRSGSSVMSDAVVPETEQAQAVPVQTPVKAEPSHAQTPKPGATQTKAPEPAATQAEAPDPVSGPAEQ